MSDVTILISTVDEYCQVWPVTCYGLTKYWHSRTWPALWYTNELDAPCGETFKTGADRHWTRMTRQALGRVATPVILFMLEDVWLCDRPDGAALADFAAILARGEADHIQLQSPPRDRSRFKGPFKRDPRLLEYAHEAPYRVNLQPSLWRTDALASLLADDRLPGDFEPRGSKRSQGRDGYLCIAEYGYMRYVQWGAWVMEEGGIPFYWAQNPISRGRWTDGARQYAAREGLELDFSRDPTGGF